MENIISNATEQNRSTRDLQQRYNQQQQQRTNKNNNNNNNAP